MKLYYWLFLIVPLLIGCTSKIERTVILTPLNDYLATQNVKSLNVVNSSGAEGIVTSGSGPMLEETYKWKLQLIISFNIV